MKTKHATELTNRELLDAIVENSRQNEWIRELARRLHMGMILPEKPVIPSRKQVEEDRAKRPKEYAAEMIASPWPMRDFHSMSPREIYAFVENVRTGFTEYERMSEGQAKLWASVVSKYEAWRRSFRETVASKDDYIPFDRSH